MEPGHTREVSRGKGGARRGQRWQWGSLVLVSPGAVLLGALFVVPVGYAVYLAFTNTNLLELTDAAPGFVGLANFTHLAHDSTLQSSLVQTFFYVVGSGIVGQTVLGLALALLMRRSLAAIRIPVGMAVIIAWVIPEVTAAFVWYAFTQQGGTLGDLLGNSSTSYLLKAPLLVVSIANLWRNVAFSMLIFSAGLRNLPTDVDEAASLEGASATKRLFTVTLPMLRPLIVMNILLVSLTSLGDFTLVWVMTQGGPGTSTAILPVYTYLVSFQLNALGYGSAVAVLLILCGALVSLFYVRSVRRDRKAGLA